MSSSADTLSASAPAAAAGSRSRLPWFWLTALFIGGVLFSSGYTRVLADLGISAFKHIARAQYELHQATKNVNADGRPEFAVLLASNAGDDALARFLDENPGWQSRAASIPGWAVISAPADTPGVGSILREQAFTKAVLRNRGIWICH